MEQVKGSVIVFFVKYLRKSKDQRVYDYLTEEDRAIISQRIFPSSWYPLDTFWRILTAFYEVYGEKNPEALRQWGKSFGFQSLTEIYKDLQTFIRENPIPESIKYFCRLTKSFFSYTRLEPVSVGNRNAVLTLTNPGEHPAEKIFYQIIGGYLEKVIERGGGMNPQIELREASAEDKPSIEFHLAWE